MDANGKLPVAYRPADTPFPGSVEDLLDALPKAVEICDIREFRCVISPKNNPLVAVSSKALHSLGGDILPFNYVRTDQIRIVGPFPCKRPERWIGSQNTCGRKDEESKS